MLSEVWKGCYASVCKLQFINERGIEIDSLTGFKVGKSLVTCEQAFYIENAHKVEIRFVDEDANTMTSCIRVDYREFINDLRVGFVNNHSDYAVFNIDFPEFASIPSLSLCERRNHPIGSSVAVFSYNYGQKNLNIRSAIISSAYSNSDGVRYLQIDGLTCSGNSGAPVINPETKEVIAILSRRNSPASKTYKELLNYINQNIEELKRINGKLRVDTVDPMQVLITNQNQIKHLATNIYRYSAIGQTSAVMLDRILSYFNEQLVFEQPSVAEIAKVGVD
ncbi:MAG: trypsin-like peptidase domain-containing protein [Bacteroidales bacterium]|nr:trypsin-like peptidase domain-containing protein [Bacteroidales bacterium]HPD96200.1 serine protease [Tenuifilaceae bacterium]HRX31785.1 serine protease [Tenuifilaceae bacterium]